jgi:hypothetical protein
MYHVLIWLEQINNTYIFKYVTINRLGWEGRVIRTDNKRTVKKVFNTKSTGIRKIERPKLRWEDVIQDIKTLGVKNWRNVAMEKGKLEKASEEGQGPRRAVEPMMMT